MLLKFRCTITLKIDEDMHYRVRDEFEDEDITENDDGTFTVKTLMPDDEWGYGCIMSYGEHAEVLAPYYIRTLIQNKFKEVKKNIYNTTHSCHVRFIMLFL